MPLCLRVGEWRVQGSELTGNNLAVPASSQRWTTAPSHTPILETPHAIGMKALRGELTRLPLQIDELLQHFVGGRNGLRVGLERPLVRDEVDELFGEIDVGLFE